MPISPLAWILAGVLVTCLGALVAARWTNLSMRGIVVVQVGLVAGALAVACVTFLGIERTGSPRLDADKSLRFLHLGYYGSTQGTFRFGGGEDQGVIPHQVFHSSEYLALRPVVGSGRVSQWSVEGNSRRLPLRVDDRCINVSDGNWIGPNQVLRIVRQRGAAAEALAVRYTRGPLRQANVELPRWAGQREAFRIARLDRGSSFDAAADWIDDSPRIHEARTLGSLLAVNATRIRSRQWSLDQPWIEAASAVILVRERKGDLKSRLGVLVNWDRVPGGFSIVLDDRPLVRDGAPVRDDFPGGSRVNYGIGSSAFSIRTGNRVSIVPEFGQVVELNFALPVSFPLPPDRTRSFLITSATDFVPMNGFRFPLGERAATFYVKAEIDWSDLNLRINDGARRASYPAAPGRDVRLETTPESVIALGTRALGVLVAFQKPGGPLPYTGLIALAGVLLLSLAFVFLALAGMVRDDAIIEAVWATVWCLLLTILTVRTVLAYRAALLPPSDASPDELTGVFLGAVPVSIAGLCLLPLLLLAARFICWRLLAPGILAGRLADLLDRWVSRLRDGLSGARLLLWLTPVAIYIALARLFGTNESFGMRVNMMVHLFTVIPFAIVSGNLDRYSPSERWLLAGSLTLPSVLVIAVIHDFGSVTYFLGMLSTSVLLLFLYGAWRRKLAFGIGAAFMLAPWLFGLLVGSSLPGLRPLIYPALPDTAFYRVVTQTRTEEAVLLEQAGDRPALDIDKLLRNSQQAWQMLSFVSRGSERPAGFGQAPLTKIAMTYPTSMADCAYAVFLTSEHGSAAAVFMIVVFICLGAACFNGGICLPRGQEWRTIPLAMTGVFFAMNAVYMASANVGLLPFTGQNIPLLGLYSRGDLVQSAALLTLTTILFFWDVSGVSPRRATGASPLAIGGAALFIGFLVWMANVSWQHGKLAEAGSTDFRFSESLLRGLENDLPGRDRNGPWRFDQTRLELIPASGKLSLIENAYGRQFNQRVNKFSPEAGLYYLERVPPGSAIADAEYRVRVNENYIRLKDPFRPSPIYEGSIYASRTSTLPGSARVDEPVVAVLGQPFRVGLRRDGHAQTLVLTAPFPAEVSSGVVIQGSDGGHRLLEIFRTGQELSVAQQFEGSEIYIDGERLAQGKTRQLQPGNLIVCFSGRDRHTLIYLGLQPRVLAYTQWMNGRRRRIFTPEGDASEVWAIGEALDEAVRDGRPVPANFALTLAPDLQGSLDDALSRVARGDPRWSGGEGNPDGSPRISVAVIDAYDGDLLASAAWPRIRPSSPRFDEYVRSPDWRRQQLTRDPALVGHNIGSTVKPLVFASVASQLWPDRDLAKLTVFNNGAGVGGGHMHDSIAGLRLRSAWDCESFRQSCDARTFLVDSVNFYQATVGFMGLWLRKEDWKTSMIPGGPQPDLTYDGQPYRLDLTAVPDSPLTLQDFAPQPRTDSMKRTLLFRGLADLFDAGLDDDETEATAREVTRFLPGLAPASGKLPGAALRLAVPEPARLMPQSFQDLRGDFISYLLGGSRCRWSNIKMAEAYARLATGVKVVSHIEDAAMPKAAAMPAPIGAPGWRNRNLIEPMRLVSEEGTAVRLRGLVSSPLTAIYKTGTVNDDSEWESEFLAFVIGEYDGHAFVHGRSVAGYIWLESSKRIRDKGSMKKFMIAEPMVKALARYLSNR